VDASLDLPPERAACAASAEADAADGDAECGEEREGVLERVGNALQHGASEVGGGVCGADAGEGCADCRIEVRRALAEQVRSPFEAFTAGRDFGGCGGQRVVIGASKEGLLE